MSPFALLVGFTVILFVVACAIYLIVRGHRRRKSTASEGERKNGKWDLIWGYGTLAIMFPFILVFVLEAWFGLQSPEPFRGPTKRTFEPYAEPSEKMDRPVIHAPDTRTETENNAIQQNRKALDEFRNK